jgi:hypothetical protein
LGHLAHFPWRCLTASGSAPPGGRCNATAMSAICRLSGAKRTCTDNQVRHVPSAALACAVAVAMCLHPDPIRRAFLLVYRRR